jgi:hypothetical protein
VDNWKKLTNSRNGVRKKSFGGTFCFSNCHIIGLDTGGLVFLVSGCGQRGVGLGLWELGCGRHQKDIYQRILISYPISENLQKGYFLSFFGAGYIEDIISYF